MMRVHVRESADQCTLFVEGAIASTDATELESCWRSQACTGKKAVVLDFTRVLRIDREGRALLRLMHLNGVRFTGAQLAIADTLEQIVSSADSFESRNAHGSDGKPR